MVRTETIDPAGASWLADLWPDSYSVSWPPDVDFDWDLAANVQSPSGGSLLTDYVDINAEGAMPFLGYSSVALTGAGIPSLTVRDETVHFQGARATNISFADGAFSFSFETQPRRVYTVHYKNSLDDAEWLILETVPGDGTVKTVTDDTASGPSRFYRVE